MFNHHSWGFRQVESEHENGHLLPPDAMIFASEHFKRDARHEMANMRSNTASGQKRKIIASLPITLIPNSSANSLNGTRAEGGSSENCLTVGLESSAPKRARGSFNGFESSEAGMQSKRNSFSSRRDLFHNDSDIYTPSSFPEGADATQHALDVLKKLALDHTAITSLMQNDQCNGMRENIMSALFSRGNSSSSNNQVKMCPNAQHNPFWGPQQNIGTKYRGIDLFANPEITHPPSENIQGYAASVGNPVAQLSMMENQALMQALASMAAGTTNSSGTGSVNVLVPPIAMLFAHASSAKGIQRQPDLSLSIKSPEGTAQNSTVSSLSGVTNMTNTTSSIHGNEGNIASYQYALAQALRTLLFPQSLSLQQTFDVANASINTNRSSSASGDQPALHAQQSLPSETLRRNFASVSSAALPSGQVDLEQKKRKLAMLFRSAAETLEKENSYFRVQPLSVRTGHFQHQGNKRNQLDQQMASSQQRRQSSENAYVAAPFPQHHRTNVAPANISMVTKQNQHCGNHLSGQITSLNNRLNSSNGNRDHPCRDESN